MSISPPTLPTTTGEYRYQYAAATKAWLEGLLPRWVTDILGYHPQGFDKYGVGQVQSFSPSAMGTQLGLKASTGWGWGSGCVTGLGLGLIGYPAGTVWQGLLRQLL